MPEMQSKYGNVAGNVDSWGPIVNSNYDPRDFFRTGSNVINSVALSTGNQKNQSYLSASTTNTTNILQAIRTVRTAVQQFRPAIQQISCRTVDITVIISLYATRPVF